MTNIKITESTKVTIHIQASYSPTGEPEYLLCPPDCIPCGFVPSVDMIADILRQALSIVQPKIGEI